MTGKGVAGKGVTGGSVTWREVTRSDVVRSREVVEEDRCGIRSGGKPCRAVTTHARGLESRGRHHTHAGVGVLGRGGDTQHQLQ